MPIDANPGVTDSTSTVEGDTFFHSWEVVAQILNDPATKDMLVDVGMGVRHRVSNSLTKAMSCLSANALSQNVRYNCRILLTYQKIFFIRPKMSLANDGLYREARHFTAWAKPRTVETYYLEQVIRDITGQKTVPIGDAVLSTLDTSVG